MDKQDKKLSSLIPLIKNSEILGSDDILIKSITLDSRNVSFGSLFIAQKGEISDGNDYINDAFKKGARVVVTNKKPEIILDNITYIIVHDTEEVTAIIASWFYDFPAKKLKVFGVTGTNGKTTVSTLLWQALNITGEKTGLIGTIANFIGNEKKESTHTTPDAISLQKILKEMVSGGCKNVVMEVSSHAIAQKRIHGIDFSIGIFTNLTQDHLDFHKTMDEYAKTKKRFFTKLDAKAFAISNIDDEKGLWMIKDSPATKITYSIKNDATFKSSLVSQNGSSMILKTNEGELETLLIGTFNIYNTLAVYATLRTIGYSYTKIKDIFLKLTPPKGRLETIISSDKKIGVIDYAHTPDGLLKIIEAIRNTCTSKEKIITVFGCGGDRDKTKRPIMGNIASSLSDHTIITSDNPRTEDGAKIIEEVFSGVKDIYKNETEQIIDRREAIKKAVSISNPGDYIILAGKGHEEYQIIGTEKIHFSDREELIKIFTK